MTPRGPRAKRITLRRAAGVLMLAGWLLAPAAAGAGSALGVVISGGALKVTAKGAAAAGVAAAGFTALGAGGTAAWSERFFPGPTYLIVDAMPLEAEVFLDGRRLGSARELVARALPVAPGWHALEIVAPAFRPYVATFAAPSGGFPIRVQTVLAPD